MRWSTGRVEAFSDGVLAIAITLLVLEIKVEPHALEHPWQAIADEWPSYLAYVTSFLTIGGVWMAHHALFHHLKSSTRSLMRLNILLLMVVSFLPFPTGLMAEALQTSRPAERAALVIYGATAFAIELLDRGHDALRRGQAGAAARRTYRRCRRRAQARAACVPRSGDSACWSGSSCSRAFRSSPTSASPRSRCSRRAASCAVDVQVR